MKTTIALFAVLLGFATAVNAEPKAQPDAAAWETLFTGDLSDAIFPEGVWSIKDGMLSATKDECIWTKKQYENFTLDLEFKTTKGANSGVIVYCNDLKDWIPTAMEIQLLDDTAEESGKLPKTWQCAAIFGRLAPTKSTVKKPGEWNHMTIVCNGKNITVTLNGETVTKMDMSKWTSAKKNPDGSDVPEWINKLPISEIPTKGHIGLQGKHAGVPTYFRNVKIKKN
jgi:hypothetical protein